MLESLESYQYYIDRLGRGLFFEGAVDLPSLTERWRFRDTFIHKYGFAILTRETRDVLASLLRDRKVLEAGSGTGYIAQALHEAGVEVTAADFDVGHYGFAAPYRRDINADAVTLLPGNYRAVLLVWPCYGSPFAYQVATAMKPGQLLIFQGEGCGGCTGDDAFFDELELPHWALKEEATNALNEHHVQFPGINDRWTVFERLA